VQYLELAQGNLLTHKMNIQFNMLCSSMMYRILGEVYCRYVVTIDHRGLVNDDVELLKKIVQPAALRSSIGYCTIFSFGA
jgi:hypothetical protein